MSVEKVAIVTAAVSGMGAAAMGAVAMGAVAARRLTQDGHRVAFR